jgi:uncharacterized protein
MSPVRATSLLGFVWGLWHLPIYGPLAPLLITALAFFSTYLYNKPGSLWLAILMHATITPANDNVILMPRDVPASPTSSSSGSGSLRSRSG